MNTIKIKGKIKFDPQDKTNKHKAQSAWKIVAMVEFKGDLSEYYAWFIKKRYSLVLNAPLRGSHITFINDKFTDIDGENDRIRKFKWNQLKNKWDGKEIEITLSVDVRSNKKHWWVNIPEEDRGCLHDIRSEIDLGRPHWGLHMSIGYANERNIEHSEYIVRMLEKGLIK